MAEELLINVSEFETRVALLAGGATQEIHLARSDGYSVTGNIFSNSLGPRSKLVNTIPRHNITAD